MPRCRECNFKISRSVAYCPNCGVRDPAQYEVRAPDEIKVRKRSNFVVPLLGVGMIVAMVAVYKAAHVAYNKSSDTVAITNTDSIPNFNLLENKEFLAKNPKYPEAIRALITSYGYECPRLTSLSFAPEGTPMGNKLEALCGARGGTGTYTALHYSVYPDHLKVVVCKPLGVRGGACD
jgi:hypothetical protein